MLCYDKETKQKIFGVLNDVPKSHSYYVEGEEEVNRVIHLLRAEANYDEEQRSANMEKVLKDWGLNRGLWLTEMRIKLKIDKIQPVK